MKVLGQIVGQLFLSVTSEISAVAVQSAYWTSPDAFVRVWGRES